jgi:uncharacterized protein
MLDFATEQRAKTSAPPAVANPGPLGLSAFALTTFVLSAHNAGLLGGSAVNIVLSLALFYGGLTQFCAGMWEFKTGNVFGGTAFSSYGGFWLAVGFALLPIFAGGQSLAKLAGEDAMGVFFLGWTIFTGMMLLVTLKVSIAHIILFLLLFLTFLFLAIGALNAAADMTIYAGWLGLVTAMVAWYAALSQVLSATNSPIKLPLFPLS